jgi:alpha-beta hydrolase superfamily lysophospholipase
VRIGLKKELMEPILWLIAAYIAMCVAVFFGNRLFMYFPDPTRVAPADAGLKNVKEIEIEAADGVTLVAWHARANGDKPTILYFHGNGANVAARALRIEMICASGFGVLYLNNRGYGGSGGRPTEADNVSDAIAAYDHLIGLGVSAQKIVAYGESLGSGQAVRLATARPISALILEAPLTSTIDVAQSIYFWLPLGFLITDKYHIEHHIRSVTAPVLILHGKRDEVIPVEMGWRIFRAANEPKRLELFSEATHDDLFAHGAWEKIRAFLAGADAPQAAPHERRSQRNTSPCAD